MDISWPSRSRMSNEGRRWIRKGQQGSISPTFYAQLLRMLVGRAAFLCLHFRFVLYWRKPTGAKAAHRTLMKLTPDYRRQIHANHQLSPMTELRIRVQMPLKMFLVEKISVTYVHLRHIAKKNYWFLFIIFLKEFNIWSQIVEWKTFKIPEYLFFIFSSQK